MRVIFVDGRGSCRRYARGGRSTTELLIGLEHRRSARAMGAAFPPAIWEHSVCYAASAMPLLPTRRAVTCESRASSRFTELNCKAGWSTTATWSTRSPTAR